jgi:hypothetical protein
MKLPKFWKDTGTYNDPLISLTILGSIILGIVSALHFEVHWLFKIILGLGGCVLGIATGFLVIYILCTFFSVDDSVG